MAIPFWINPCNIEKPKRPPRVNEIKLEGPKPPEAELVNNILHQTNIALIYAYQIKNQFISTIFRKEWDQIEEMYKDNKLCWLPTTEDIPKIPGQSVSLSKLKNIRLSAILPNLYTCLQKIAAGMELVFKTDDYKRFKECQWHLKNVLCELFTAMKESKIEMPKDVTRAVVPQYYRNLKKPPEMKVRDYIVFRDYINILEYTVEVFNNIVQKYPTISFFKPSITVQS